MAVLANMFMANKAPSTGRMWSGSITKSRRRSVRPAARPRCTLANNARLSAPRVLMGNGTHPGEIGPGGQLVGVEIAGHQLDPRGKLAARQSRAGLLDGVGQVEDRGPGGRQARRKAKVHVPEAPPTSNKCSNCGGPSRATRSSATGPETTCMAATKAARSASAPRMLACRGGGMPVLPTAASCVHARRIVMLCQIIGRMLSGSLRSASRAARRAPHSGPPLVEQIQGRHRVQQHGRRPQVGAQPVGQLLGRQPVAAEGGEDVQFRGRPHDTGGLEGTH